MKSLLMLIISIFFIADCGVKSPPLPPMKHTVSETKENNKKKTKKNKKTKQGDSLTKSQGNNP